MGVMFAPVSVPDAEPVDTVALAVMAHPDDVEFLCAGTLALFQRRGWDVHIATLTAGDAGSDELGPAEIARVRRGEAQAAADVLRGRYHCLDCLDGFIVHDKPTLLKVIRLLRQTRPALIFTHSPADYLVDHEMVSGLVRTATFFATVPNVVTDPVAPLAAIPHLYYADAIGGTDIFGETITPELVVDITSTIDTKALMLGCHASQREWLLRQHGLDAYDRTMRHISGECGRLVDVGFGEGFRQHLGHGYPASNLLGDVLAGHVRPMVVADGAEHDGLAGSPRHRPRFTMP